MKKFLLSCSLVLLLLPLFPQDAEKITQILNTETATYMDFSYLIVSDLGMVCSPFEAYSYCDRFGNFRFTANANTPITVKTLSHFLMQNYNLKGGILWTVFRNPRYAFKELKTANFWMTGTDPDNTLSGRDLVRAISRFSVLYPNAQLRNPQSPNASSEQKNALLAGKENRK